VKEWAAYMRERMSLPELMVTAFVLSHTVHSIPTCAGRKPGSPDGSMRGSVIGPPHRTGRQLRAAYRG